MPNPWSNQLVSLIVVTLTTGFSGVFGYSPSTGFGNLIFSVTAAAGTDPFGNAYLAGITVYQPGGFFIACNLAAGQLSFYTATGAGGPYTLQSDIQSDNVGDLLINAANAVFSGNVQVPGATASLTVGTTTTLTATGATIGNGATAQLQLNPPMATPPNAAAVAAGTATLAQLMAFCNGLYQSMKNRGMFN